MNNEHKQFAEHGFVLTYFTSLQFMYLPAFPLNVQSRTEEGGPGFALHEGQFLFLFLEGNFFFEKLYFDGHHFEPEEIPCFTSNIVSALSNTLVCRCPRGSENVAIHFSLHFGNINLLSNTKTSLWYWRFYPTSSIASMGKFGSIIGARSAVCSLARE